MNVKVGDWVTSYSSGIWRVYRVLENVVVANSSGGTKTISLIFSNRFLSSSYKPLFKSECCAPSFVEKLNSEETSKLNDYISKNPEQFERFDKKEPKIVNAYTDAFFTKPSNKTIEEINNYFELKQKIKASDIHKVMEQFNLTWKGNPGWRVEFISENHEVLERELVYTFNKVLEF